MSDLDLHRRLSDLADDLAHGADPFARVGSARSAHRRRRRNRILLAGAVAVVAVLGVGIPTAVSTLSVPEGRQVAAPTTESASPTEGESTESPGSPPISQLNQDFIEVVDTLSTRTPLDLAAPPEPASCPDATASLSDAVATVLTPLDSDDANQGCGWTTTELRADRLALGIAFLRTADDAVLQMIIDETAKTMTGQKDAAEHPGTCFSSDLSDAPRRTTVQACSVAGRGTQWTVFSDVGGGAGLWQLTVNVPADVDGVDHTDAVLALVDVAEAAW